MARISVEQKALTDSRFAQLGIFILDDSKLPVASAAALGLGVMIHVWNECQEQETYSLPFMALTAIGLRFGLACDLASCIVRAQLGADASNSRIRIRGARGRIEWLQKRRSDGKTGGRPRKTLGLDKKHPGDNPPAPAPTPALTPTEESEKTTTLVRPKRSNGERVAPAGIVKPSPLKDPERVKRLEEDFLTLYQFYPRHVGKEAAWSAFTKLDPDVETLREIARDIKQRTTDGEWVPTDPERVRFIPHLGTYLNQRRWTDER